MRPQQRRLRVVLVGPPLQFLFGGQEVQAHSLISAWDHDSEVIVTFASSRPDLPRSIARIENVRYLRTAVRLPWYLIRLFGAAKEADVVHVMVGSFSSFALVSVPSVIVSAFSSAKLLIHYHSGRGEDHLRKSYVARFVLRRCARVVVPSDFLVNAFRAQNINAETIFNVVDPERFRFRVRQPLRPRILCTRNWEARYGIEVVLRAFAKVQQEFGEATLCLVGLGGQEQLLRKLARSLSVRNVDFRGPIHPSEIHKVYDECDIFLNGSEVDCSPVSILESFCAGLPVITTAAGGIPHMVEHERTGLLCPPGDWETLARNVIRVLQHQDLAQSLAMRAREAAMNYSWPRVRSKWLELYRSLPARDAKFANDHS